MIDTRVRYAVAVSKSGSFSRAAESVGVTQSAVTKSVADLEQQLGFALFHRTSRGALLTEEGRDFMDRAIRLLADAAELFDQRDRRADPYRGVLRMGIYPPSIEWMSMAPLVQLLKHYPGIRLEIVTGTSERGVQQLLRGDIDMAFGMQAAFGSWSQFKCERIGWLEAIPFVRHGHPILEMRPVTVDKITQFDFVMPSSSEPYTSLVQHIYEASGQGQGDRLHVVDFFPLAQRIVGSTNAIGFVAKELTLGRTFNERFVALPEAKLIDGPPLCCAVRSRWPVPPAVRALIAQMRLSLGSNLPAPGRT